MKYDFGRWGLLAPGDSEAGLWGRVPGREGSWLLAVVRDGMAVEGWMAAADGGGEWEKVAVGTGGEGEKDREEEVGG